MQPLLEYWGGGFYLLNKVLFWLGELQEDQHSPKRRALRIAAWITYLIGLPAWLILLAPKDNWIVILIEIAGGVSMVVGLQYARKGKDDLPPWLDTMGYLAAVLGVLISLYVLGGITRHTQAYEGLLALGFIVGVRLQSKDNPTGYAWLAFMNLSNVLLMEAQGFYALALQQVLSMIIMLDAFRRARKRKS